MMVVLLLHSKFCAQSGEDFAQFDHLWGWKITRERFKTCEHRHLWKLVRYKICGRTPRLRVAILGQNLGASCNFGSESGVKAEFSLAIASVCAHVTENPVSVPNSNTSLGCPTWPSFWWLFPHRHTIALPCQEPFICTKIQSCVNLKWSKVKYEVKDSKEKLVR